MYSHSAAVSGVTDTAKVTAISPTGTATNSVVTYAATITLDSVPAGVRLGQTANVAVTTSEAIGVVAVPSNAVTVGVAGAGADGTTTGTVQLRAADGATTAKTVTVGVQGDSTTEIKSGVSAGDQVVVSLDTAVGTTTATTQLGGTSGGISGGGGVPAGGLSGARPGG